MTRSGSAVCSAPGKLVLLGEYAVLFGHPAVVAAVNRRARVEVRPSDGSRWQVSAPGYAEAPGAFEIRADGVRWLEPADQEAGRWALVEQVFSWLPSVGVDLAAGEPASLVLDTRAFFHDGAGGPAKLGLGSSAALAVALAAALLRRSGGAAPSLGALLDLHRRFQGGRGSGVDLAAALAGGILEYRIADGGAVPVAVPLTLPEGLHTVVAWTGRSTSTARFLERLDRCLADGDRSAAAALADLGGVAGEGVAHLRAGAVSRWLDDVDSFVAGLESLGEAAGIDILSEAHRELRRLARAAGLRYKPSGAGGGDVGVAFTDDPGAAAVFAGAATGAGFEVLGLGWDPAGLRCDGAEG
jgi:phosphomevalonate kinase